jgi:D-glycero-alpha-D-manno-heptose-7-phosphate kinase
MSAKISNQELTGCTNARVALGFIDGKITGAGGGGYMFFVTRFDRHKDVVEAVQGSGRQVRRFLVRVIGRSDGQMSDTRVVR